MRWMMWLIDSHHRDFLMIFFPAHAINSKWQNTLPNDNLTLAISSLFCHDDHVLPIRIRRVKEEYSTMCDQCYLPKAAGDMNSVYLLSNDFLFMQDVPAQGGVSLCDACQQSNCVLMSHWHVFVPTTEYYYCDTLLSTCVKKRPRPGPQVPFSNPPWTAPRFPSPRIRKIAWRKEASHYG